MSSCAAHAVVGHLCPTLAREGQCGAWPGASCSSASCKLAQPAFPSGPEYLLLGCSNMQIPHQRQQLWGVDSGRPGSSCSQAGPLGVLICPILLPNPVISCRTGCLVELRRPLQGSRAGVQLQQMSLDCIFLLAPGHCSGFWSLPVPGDLGF